MSEFFVIYELIRYRLKIYILFDIFKRTCVLKENTNFYLEEMYIYLLFIHKFLLNSK